MSLIPFPCHWFYISIPNNKPDKQLLWLLMIFVVQYFQRSCRCAIDWLYGYQTTALDLDTAPLNGGGTDCIVEIEFWHDERLWKSRVVHSNVVKSETFCWMKSGSERKDGLLEEHFNCHLAYPKRRKWGASVGPKLGIGILPWPSHPKVI